MVSTTNLAQRPGEACGRGLVLVSEAKRVFPRSFVDSEVNGRQPPAPARPQPGLRSGALSLLENLAQTLGVLSPAGTISVIIPLLIVSAGNGTWLLLLLTLSIFLLIMFSVTRFASLHASAGSLAAYSRLGWGRRGGLVGAWIYLLGMAYCIPAALLASASYVDLLLLPWLGPSGSTLRLAAVTACLTLGCWLAAHRDIKLSTNLMLGIECVSVSLMLVLMTFGMVHADAWIDRAQIELTGFHFAGLQGGLVLAFMLMAGFEGTTSLGEEAQNPQTTIPRAILTCVLPLTVLYFFITYGMVSLGNRGVIGAQINGLTVPFDNIAHAVGIPWLGPVSSLGVALSYFGCGLGSLTVASRVLYSMARDGQFWGSFGAAHPRNATPHRAIALISIISIAIPAGMLAYGAELSLSINFLSQLGSLGLIGGYFMAVVALPLYLRSRGLLRRRDILLACAASLMLILVLALSIYPRPAPPYNSLIYLFTACVAGGILISTILSRQARAGMSPSADAA